MAVEEDIESARGLLAAIVEAVESGDLDASAPVVAGLVAAVATLDSLASVQNTNV